MKKCLRCNSDFISKHKNHVYCSSRCEISARLKRKRANNPAYRERRNIAVQECRERRGRNETPEKRKKWALKKYGKNAPEYYTKQLELQENLCAICKKPEIALYIGRVRKLALDHNHATKQLRGLLCCSCNKLLGDSKEDLSILRAAINYLIKWSGNMSTFAISGNTGGTSGAGAQVQYTTDRADIHGMVIADANGVYSIPGLPDLRTYYLTVTLSGKTYRFQHSVTLAGANVVDVNFNPTAQNASNINMPGF